MTKEQLRLMLSATAFAGALTFGAVATPQSAVAASAADVKENCPNPGPWWCADGGEDDRCADGDLDWRGCKEKVSNA